MRLLPPAEENYKDRHGDWEFPGGYIRLSRQPGRTSSS